METTITTPQPELQAPKVFPLSAITARVQEILRPACAKTFWVRAEISSGRETGGSYYCDLVECTDGKVVAKMRCSIWSHDLRRMRRKFEDQGLELRLENGTSIVLCCALQYHPQHGLSLKATDADPIFALGELEQKKREIIEGLKRDGLLEPNKKLPVPDIPLRIALITSNGTAAFADFTQTLHRSGYAFTVFLADASMQGKDTEPAVLRALSILPSLNIDIAVLIRGGGSKSDLAWLDNDAIARAIAACPIPVWTGIGHEIDISVQDHVANRSFKTPTAVAEELVARCVSAERYLDESRERIKTVWQYRYDKDALWIKQAEVGIRNGVRKHLDSTRARLREMAMKPWAKVSGRLSKENSTLLESGLNLKKSALQIISRQEETLRQRAEKANDRADRFLERAGQELQAARRRFGLERQLQKIEREDERLDTRLAKVQAHDPSIMLQRGYALLRGAGGEIVASVVGRKKGESLVAQVKDGNIRVEIKDTERKKS